MGKVKQTYGKVREPKKKGFRRGQRLVKRLECGGVEHLTYIHHISAGLCKVIGASGGIKTEFEFQLEEEDGHERRNQTSDCDASCGHSGRAG